MSHDTVQYRRPAVATLKADAPFEFSFHTFHTLRTRIGLTRARQLATGNAGQEFVQYIEEMGPHAHHDVVEVYGTNAAGNSVMMRVYGFQHYFYVRPITTESITEWRTTVNYMLNRDKKNEAEAKDWEFKPVEWVTRVEAVEHLLPMYSYLPDEESLTMWRVTLSDASVLYKLKMMIHKEWFPDEVWCYTDTMVKHDLRWLVDHDLSGGKWVSVRPDQALVLQRPGEKISRQQVEIHAHYRNITNLGCEDQYAALPPLRILSFDLECLSSTGHFVRPEVEGDQIIVCSMVGVSTPRMGRADALEYDLRVSLTLGKCADVGPDITVDECDDEVRLIRRFVQWVEAYDPDIITGYNTTGFDWKYIYGRAEFLGQGLPEEFNRLSRSKSKDKRDRFQMKEAEFGNRQTTTIKYMDITMRGRISLDMLIVMRRDKKLASYSLNFVSKSLLNDQKVDMPYRLIPEVYRSGPGGVARLTHYCDYDSVLPLKLMAKMMVIPNYTEMARVTGVDLSTLLYRGQQIKVISQIMRKGRSGIPLQCVSPEILDRREIKDTYEGATVIAPVKNFYQDPIATLDFASLYPAIMQAENLCYTTFVRPRPGEAREQLLGRHQLTEDDVHTVPYVKHLFVKPHKREGLLPKILQELLAARKRAKGGLKTINKDTDPVAYAVMDGRQLALKMSANSVYGFTGAPMMPCPEIGESVTAHGRYGIELTELSTRLAYSHRSYHDQILRESHLFEEDYFDNIGKQSVYRIIMEALETPHPERPGDFAYAIARRCQDDPSRPLTHIVYGDTDSVFVHFGSITLAEAMAYGTEAGELVTKAMFRKPHDLEFEKVYQPILQINKKRYAGKKYELAAKAVVLPDGTRQINPKFKGTQLEDLFAEIDGEWHTITPTKLDAKGLEIARRDNCRLVRTIMENLMDIIMRRELTLEQVREQCRAYVHDQITKLYAGEINPYDLMISASITKEYDPDKIREKMDKAKKNGHPNSWKESCYDLDYKAPHVQIARRRLKTHPGEGYKIGDRVGYIYVDRGRDKKLKKSDLAEDAVDVIGQSLPIHYGLYVDEQIGKAVGRLLSLVFFNRDDRARERSGADLATLFAQIEKNQQEDDEEDDENDEKSGNGEDIYWQRRDKDVEDKEDKLYASRTWKLLTEQASRKRKIVHSSSSSLASSTPMGLGKFMAVKALCMVCGKVGVSDVRQACKACVRKGAPSQDPAEIVKEHLGKRKREHQELLQNARETCYKCQGHRGEIDCMNIDCDQLYVRLYQQMRTDQFQEKKWKPCYGLNDW